MRRLVLVRAARHDVTPAIARAIEGAAGLFDSVVVLCWNRGGEQLPEREVVDGVEIRRFGWAPPRRSWRTALYTFAWGIWVFGQLARRVRRGVIQVFDFDSAWAVVAAAALTRSKVVYDVRDSFAECYPLSPFQRRLAYAADWLIMAACDGFVVPEPSRLAYLGRWRRLRPVCVLPNTCHDELASLADEPGPAGARREGTVDIAYLGYLDESRGARQLLDLCERSGGSVRLLVAGSCRSVELRSRIEESQHVSWFGRLPRRRALALMRDADAVALLYDPTVPINRSAAPNKLYESLMTGTPVLAARGTNVARLVEDEGLGLVVRYDDGDDLESAVQRLRSLPVRRTFARTVRRYYEEHCRLEPRLRALRDLYLEVTGAGPGEGTRRHASAGG